MKTKATEVYSLFSTMEDEIARRRSDPILMKKVHDFFGEHELFPIANRPFAMLSRSIATPNRELEYFLDLVGLTQLIPIVLEYNGKLVTKNIEKYFLCKLHFCTEKGTVTPNKFSLIDFNTSQGKLIHHIRSNAGDTIKEVHHRLLPKLEGSQELTVIDITKWFNKVREIGDGYYVYFLSLCIIHGVLFENYLIEDEEELAFFESKILPSFWKVTEYFGVKPLIFPLLPLTNDHRKEWLYYKKEFEEMI